MVNDPDFPDNDMNISEVKSIHHSVSSDSLDDFDYKSSDIECLNVELSDDHDDKFINIQSNKTIENENNKSITNQQVAYQNPKTIILHDSTKSLLSLDDDTLKEKVISKEFSHTSKFSKKDDDFIKKEVLLRAVPDWSRIGKCINKSPRSCRDRYFNYLSDRILSPIWSMEDDVLLLKLYTSIGPHWLTIYKWFPNHSPSFIRSRCLSICSDYDDTENQTKEIFSLHHFNNQTNPIQSIHGEDHPKVEPEYHQQFISKDLPTLSFNNNQQPPYEDFPSNQVNNLTSDSSSTIVNFQDSNMLTSSDSSLDRSYNCNFLPDQSAKANDSSDESPALKLFYPNHSLIAQDMNKWNETDIEHLIALFKSHGSNWDFIAHQFTNHSPDEIRNKFLELFPDYFSDDEESLLSNQPNHTPANIRSRCQSICSDYEAPETQTKTIINNHHCNNQTNFIQTLHEEDQPKVEPVYYQQFNSEDLSIHSFNKHQQSPYEDYPSNQVNNLTSVSSSTDINFQDSNMPTFNDDLIADINENEYPNEKHSFNFNPLSDQNTYHISVPLSPNIKYQNRNSEVEEDLHDIINDNRSLNCSNFEINNNIRSNQSNNSELTVFNINIESSPSESFTENNQYRPVDYTSNITLSFAEKLKECLLSKNVDNIIHKLAQLKEEHVPNRNIIITMQSSIVDLLYSCSCWPKPVINSCFVEECNYFGKTEGQVRVHCAGAHKIDVTRCRDEIINTVAYLAKKNINTFYDLENGEIRRPEKQMLFCHKPGCGYASERDCNIRTHRNSHGAFLSHIESLGRFWGTLKSWLIETKKFPLISEFLGEGEMWACSECDYISSNSQNVKDHIAHAHKLPKGDREKAITSVMLKFEFDEFYSGEVNRQLSSDDEEQVVTSSNNTTIIENASPIENSRSDPMIDLFYNTQDLFSEENLANCKSERKTFFDLFKLALSFEDEHFLCLMTKLRDAPKFNSTQENNNNLFLPSIDVADMLRHVEPSNWPSINNLHFCPVCNASYLTITELFEHVKYHKDINADHFITNYDELLFIVQHLLNTDSLNCTIIKPDGSSDTLLNTNCICRVPECCFIAKNKEGLIRHMDSSNDANHITFRQAIHKYGHFYGALKAHFTINNKFPSLMDLFRGKASNYYMCKTCNRLLPLNSRYANNHYLLNHPTKFHFDLLDKVSTISLTLTSNDYNSNVSKDKFNIDTCKAIEETAAELRNNVSTKELLNVQDSIYRNLFENSVDDYSDNTELLFPIRPEIIVGKDNNTKAEIENLTSVNSQTQSTSSTSDSDIIELESSDFIQSNYNNNNNNSVNNAYLSDQDLDVLDNSEDQSSNHLNSSNNDTESSPVNTSLRNRPETLINRFSNCSFTKMNKRSDVNDLTQNNQHIDDSFYSNNDTKTFPDTYHEQLRKNYDLPSYKDNPTRCMNLSSQPVKVKRAPVISYFRTRSPLNGGTNRSKSDIVDSTRGVLFTNDVEKSSSSSLAKDLISNENNTQKMIALAMRWYNESKLRGSPHLPKLDRQKRKLITSGLSELFESELIPLIQKYNPDNLGDIDEDTKWIAFEGAFEEALHRMRCHVAVKLNLDPNRIYSQRSKKRWINKSTDELACIQLTIKRLRKLAADIDTINNSDDENDNRQVRQAESRLLSSLSVITNEDKMRFFGTIDTIAILDEVRNKGENVSQCALWLELTIEELIKDEMNLKNASLHAERIREAYSENPKKTLNNYILSKANPECSINEELLYDFFSKSFYKEEDEFIPDDENGLFALSSCFSEEDKNEFIKYIENIDLIENVIESRKYESAAGPDALDYSIYKLAKTKAAEFIRLIIQITNSRARVPQSWKCSIMRLIYKKGDPSLPENWRPISVSNALYRIVSCVWARAINSFNIRNHIFSPQQKGFMEGINGCSDNSAIISEIFYDAMRSHKSVFITALDFKNAFGSVPHALIIDCLKKKGFPKQFVHLIDNVYTGSTTNIMTSKFTSRDICINRGTKQGCPVSPLLFNLCLEPLFKAINSINAEDGYTVSMNGERARFSIMAYADDILLIANSRNGMERMLETCNRFCDFTKMTLAPTKSCSFGYEWIFNSRRGLFSGFNICGEEIPFVGLEESIRYLGTPISARKCAKIKTSAEYFVKAKNKIEKIIQSDLMIVQKIHAIKTFIIPSLDFILENGQMKLAHVNKLDQFISSQINKIIGANIPRAVKHASWKDGGLSIPSLREKADVGRVKALIRMITNSDPNIRILINSAINNERIKRNIPVASNDEKHSFFNWSSSHTTTERKGTNSIVQRARKSLKTLNLELTNECNDDDEFNDSTLDNSELNAFKLMDTETNKDVIFQSSKNISLFLTNQRRSRWNAAITSPSMHLHAFYSLKDNPLSSKFLIKQQYPMNDTIVKFAIKARTNNLGTPEFDELINGKEHTPCPNCLKHGKSCIQSLSHILNGCICKYPEYTGRHNRIQSIIVQHVKELPDVEEIYTDNSIHLPGIPEELARLRPDIIAWIKNRSKCIIIEISIPYASKQWNADTLETAYNHKMNKYSSLITFIRNQGINVVYGAVIVSSVGAVYQESIKDINRIFIDRKKCKTIIKRLAINAIIGSLDVWNHNTKAN
ncbi:reverse transcriptase domain-containing protein, partial [Helicobacter typhlonius]|uniref:reverse transcriptase domain-containing protein n=1 Tax=Helicobacter typhlonius TaxID=76936 RepID=UPI002FDF4C14